MKKLLNEIIADVKKYIPNVDTKKIIKAYDFAVDCHGDQKRFSGDPYIVHPLEATKILLRMRPDVDTICACILHDTVEDDRLARDKDLLKMIANEFGSDVAGIVDGVSKVGKIKYRGQEREIESFRKMFITMAHDIRVIIVRLADRLHNMQTLQYHKNPEKINRIALETLEIYVSIAARLGFYQIKQEMEDLCFKFLNPEEYRKLEQEMNLEKTYVDKKIKEGINKLKKLLRNNKINAEVSGRVKNFYSIYKKIKKKGIERANQVNDIFALRIIVDDIQTCYAVLGLVHTSWTPVTQRFKDYIAKKKLNGYQSLHTEVVGLLDRPTEIQIRSYAMHNTAEFGVAAHWHYKENQSSILLSKENKNWIHNIVNRHTKKDSPIDMYQEMQLDFFDDEIFVYTPNGEIKTLPEGSTPIDFAYMIHTDVGNCAKMAKVDGKIVSLDYKLRNSETVEILTRKDPSPSQYWLHFVKTNSAREKIKTWLSAQHRDEYIKIGIKTLDDLLIKNQYAEMDKKFSILAKYGGAYLTMSEREDLLEKIGNNSIPAITVLKKIYPELSLYKSDKKKNKNKNKLKTKANLKRDKEFKDNGIIVGGEKNLKIKFGACCSPKFGDAVFGYATRGGIITIHKKDCARRESMTENQILPAYWEGFEELQRYFTEIEIDYSPGFLSKILDTFFNLNIEVLSLQKNYKKDKKILIIEFLLFDIQKYKLSDALKAIPEIKHFAIFKK